MITKSLQKLVFLPILALADAGCESEDSIQNSDCIVPFDAYLPNGDNINQEWEESIRRAIEGRDLEKIYEEDLQVPSVTGFGATPEDVLSGAIQVPPDGLRFDSRIEGTIQGQINGRISGIDYLTALPDLTRVFDVRATIETDDGHRIAVMRYGRAVPRPGEPTTSDITEFLRLSTSAEPYLWVNGLQIYGVGNTNAATGSARLEWYIF